MLKAEDLARLEDHRVRDVKSGRTRPDRGISHVCFYVNLLLNQRVNSYSHVRTVSYPNHSVPGQT